MLHGCFIATAAFGSADGRSSTRCARFRDRALLTTPLGQLAVAVYYAMSPPLARAIASDERLRAGARTMRWRPPSLLRALGFCHNIARR